MHRAACLIAFVLCSQSLAQDKPKDRKPEEKPPVAAKQEAKPAQSDASLNTLTDAEKKAGWKLLFDGKTTAGWTGFRSDKIPAGWKVVDGALARGDGGGDIVTTDQYDSFELALEWRIAEGGNSGIFFHVTDDHEQVWATGSEMQILDNAKHADGKSPLTSAGSNYGLHAPAKDMTKPIGEFNKVRLLVKGNHVEHWLNDVKVVEYELHSPEWKALVAKSKFKDMPNYGQKPKGRIALQDHGDQVWFRNIKIRPIAAP